jgi:hypothetical protein
LQSRRDNSFFTLGNMFQLQKAERKKSKIRIGMAGPSGSGKTYGALLLGRGLASAWDKVALIDTENSGNLYDHLGDYMHGVLEPPFTPKRYMEAIQACEAAGMEVIVIDSMTHEWDGLGGYIEASEKLGQVKYKGNSWAAKSETKPEHQKLIYAIIQSPCHIISTVRSKVETVMGEDKKVRKVGMKTVQEDGFEYEFTVFFDINRETHMATASKDRTQMFEGSEPFVITEETGRMIKAWTDSGKDDTTELERAEKRKAIGELLAQLGKTEEWYFSFIGKTFSAVSMDGLDKIISDLQARVEKKAKDEEERKRQEKEEGRLSPEEEAKIPDSEAKELDFVPDKKFPRRRKSSAKTK